ncbi:tripartite tricarboxylate transporter TctB family protein [Boseongicola sp. H5]|uniref:tripartite tricarboxylate transporter TctB family protein n=1 Tax=Boseongicola sp. H5 TaxID=2763261 RepID=UPI001B067D4B|nr:tripartite tricarboxylate transporter TctB family protein [Boseongicola sp. H5]MBO6921966.1 tripartite tricarboxylate transporter TctB family protein [Roseicyclus sp.]
MRQARAADTIIGLAFVALGSGIIFVASGFRTLPGMVVGSGLFPTVTGAAMILFGLVMALEAARMARRFDPPGDSRATHEVGSDTPTEDTPPLFYRYTIAVTLALSALIVAMPVIGFLATGFAFTVFAVKLGGGSWIGAILFSAIAVVSLYFVFTQGLRVPLPRGPF